MGEPEHETSGVTTRVVVLYVRQHGGDQAVADMLEHAGETRSADELLDEHGWSSYEQKVRLFRAAVEILGDPGAVRRIGQFMLRSRIALRLLVLLRALGSPEQVLRNMTKANSRFSPRLWVTAPWCCASADDPGPDRSPAPLTIRQSYLETVHQAPTGWSRDPSALESIRTDRGS